MLRGPRVLCSQAHCSGVAAHAVLKGGTGWHAPSKFVSHPLRFGKTRRSTFEPQWQRKTLPLHQLCTATLQRETVAPGVYTVVTKVARREVLGPARGSNFQLRMSYLRALPRLSDFEPARAVTVVSPVARDVLYVDQGASIEIITEALKAWGLRVRAERETNTEPSSTGPLDPAEDNWQTTRPEGRAPGRLENELSPLWLPIREPATGNDPVAAFGWFTRAA